MNVKKVKKTLAALFLILLIVGTIWILIDARTAPYRKMEGKIFGTYYHIVYQSSANYDRDVLAQLEAVDAAFSTFNPQSIVSRINRNEPTQTTAMFNGVFDMAMDVARATNGNFDITVAPLVNLWGFGFNNSSNVTQAAIDSIMPFVGYTTIQRNGNHIAKLHPQTMLDFSAIAKGYGCDAAASTLERHGINNYLIEIGGEIRAKGINQDRRQWTVGIVQPTDNPSAQGQQLEATVSMKQLAMATSGNYRNFYYKNGKKYAHTIDPRTGKPVQHSLLSATVIAPTCAEADAYATAFMVMGLEKARQILANKPRLKAHLIYAQQNGAIKTWTSPSLHTIINRIQ